MNSRYQLDGLTATGALCLAFLSMPALAVINQTVEFPHANNVQSATLVIDGSDEEYFATAPEDDDSNDVVFLLPDDASGKQATVYAVVDGQSQELQFNVGQGPVVFLLNFRDLAASGGGWFFGAGVSAGKLYSDQAVALATQSALDASNFLGEQGVININSSSSADDSASAWNGIVRVGYRFPDDGQLSMDFRKGGINDFELNVDVSGDIPQTTSVATAQSVGSTELETWSLNLIYQRFFSPTSNFGFAVSLGNLSVKRNTSFVSTLGVDGVPVGTMSGGDKLDENVLQYGAGLQWTPRDSRGNWVPTVGVSVLQSGDVTIFGDKGVTSIEAYVRMDRFFPAARLRF